MTIFIDASALVSMLANESDAFEIAARVRSADRAVTSPLAVWEAVTALHKSHRFDLDDARTLVREFIAFQKVAIVDIDAQTAEIAMDAFDRFGKGRHPARLNLGDCFAYASARVHGVKLLYKGEDFARTDLA